MIGTSLSEYVFIRACIFSLYSIPPLSLFYCLAVYPVKILPYRTFWFLEDLIILEAAFYLLVYLPRKHYLQEPAVHPTALPREERYDLFRRCHENIPDPERYLSRWFLDAPLSEIKRDNVRDFLRWGFLNTGKPDQVEDEELETYISEVEEMLDIKFEPGRGKAKCLTLTVNPVEMLHRSVTWYLCVGFVDTLTYLRMLRHSFHFHRVPVLRSLAIFPPRPLAFLSSYRSPVSNTAYWHRPHTSRTQLPILFIHGIGIGLYPYVSFLAELNQKESSSSDDGQVGIIAVELMPMSFRITHAALGKDDLCEEIRLILAKHGWEQFVLVSHSYGSVISTHLLHTPRIAKHIKAILLIDPITFLLHMPDVAYNFTRRKPTHANEHQLYYFASRDMGVSHTLSRRFFWSESIMWKHDIAGRPVTVSLGGRDLIVDTATVRDYLTRDWGKYGPNGVGDGQVEDEREDWKPDILWFKDLDHAQVFDTKQTRRRLVDVVRRYCWLGK